MIYAFKRRYLIIEIRLDRKATKIFALVHSDLAGPIQLFAKDGYRYVFY